MSAKDTLLSVSSDRAAPAASSRLVRLDHAHDDVEKQRLSIDLENANAREDEEFLPKEKQGQPPEPKSSFTLGLIWMIINTLATIGIVFTNKAIFSDPSLKLAQLTFAAFHFFVTFLTLFLLSRPPFSLFPSRRVPLLDILPLSIAMALNVILPNLSLAFSTVTFYQIARILLTPTVAVLNYALYRSTLPPLAILALVPACVGVGMVSYYDSLPPPSRDPTQRNTVATTHPLGVLFALSGTLASSLYTVWIAASHRRLRLSSMQLLLNQAPLAAVLLLYAIPFLDTWPASWSALPAPRWALVLLSGALAAVLNASQFFIVAQAGAVSSTVVGHVKTVTIVGLGWVVSGRGLGVEGTGDAGRLGGVVVAVGGIVAYSVVMLREREKGAGVGLKGK